MKSTLMVSMATLVATAGVALAEPGGNAGEQQKAPAVEHSPAGNGAGAGASGREAPDASDVAPGRVKGDKESAREYAPGQKKEPGESAKDLAPGKNKHGADATTNDSMKKDDQGAASGGMTDKSKSGASEGASTGAGERAGKGEDAGKKGSIAEVTTEQKTRIRSAFRGHRDHVINDVDFSLNIGIAVPRTVTLYAVPEDIIVIAPAYRDYRFFIVGDRVCIVDPITLEIVDILVIA